MNDDDDLGNFFDEINQIEDTVTTEPALKPESIDVSVSSNFIAADTSASSSRKSTTNAVPNIVTVISSKPQVVSKPAEITSNPREVYTYGGINSENGVEVASGFIRDAAREIREFTSSATNVTIDGLTTTSASTSSSKNSGQSIGPIIGPPGPPSGPHPSSYVRQKPSGGLNLSLHSYSTSYVTSTGNLNYYQKNGLRTLVSEMILWYQLSILHYFKDASNNLLVHLNLPTLQFAFSPLFQHL